MIFLKVFKPLIDNLGYIVLIIFCITHLKGFKKLIIKDSFEFWDKIFLGIIFGCFGVLGTYSGTNINGAIANTRNIGVVVGGILAGPLVGSLAGVIAGVHRFLLDPNGITTIACVLTTILAGIISGYIYNVVSIEKRWFFGLLTGWIIESVSMIFILIFSKPINVAYGIVKNIFVPMTLINGIGIAIVIIMIENIFKEKDELEANQAKLALKIASKTLPYFRNMNMNSLTQACRIIQKEVEADAVAITDLQTLLVHVGIGEDHHISGNMILTDATKKAIKEKKIQVINQRKDIGCFEKKCPLKSAIVVPLMEKEKIIGSLKIYFQKENAVSVRDKILAQGLSQLISTQLEISKLDELKKMANKAELKALQAQINPHFLFNALNTIVSFIRISPNEARKLIINLSTYLRYNLETDIDFVDIKKEIEHVKAYVQIEKARFQEKLKVNYDIKEEISIKLPPLIIQPIVENSIKHGILEGSGNGEVLIKIEKEKNKYKVIILDDGIGIDERVIKEVYEGKKEGKIGLSNVHNRLKLIYGEGLEIERLQKGTKVSFCVYKLK